MSAEKSRKLVCQVVTPDFAKAVGIVTVSKPTPKEDEILVKTSYVGINATDLNITASRYFASTQVPFDIGLEGVGEIVEIGSKVQGLKVGQAVAYMSRNAYTEHACFPAKMAIPVPNAKPEFVALLISGLTATIGLDRVGEIKKGEKVLITAAAGGLGQFAVQWAKQAGCHVIGTCSTNEKSAFLKTLGCDFVINYKEQDLGKVLKEHYPDGIDVVWETIGGKVFETLVDNLAIKGRLVVIGAIEGYKTVGAIPVNISTLPAKLIFRSTSVRGFLLTHFPEDFGSYFSRMAEMISTGKLLIRLDDGKDTPQGVFRGLESITRAIEHLHSGKSSGKVVVGI